MTTLLINPPPSNMCCERCGKHISELKPFGKAGDPLVGDFNGQILVKTFRGMVPHLSDEELKEYSLKHGEEKAEMYDQAMNTIGASWECRNCIIKQ